MDVDRKTVVQIVVAVVTVSLFIGGLVMITGAYGETVEVGPDDEEGQLDGELSGTFAEEVTEGDTAGEFSGEFENDIIATLEGDVDGTFDDGSFTGEFNGTISGAIDGTASGEMDGTVEDGEFEGSFQGTAEGETRTDLTPDGGLILVALIVAYIILLPLVGYVIERHEFADE